MISGSLNLARRVFDVPVAVLGDLHGRLDVLDAMLAKLPATMPLLFTGDLCDRGPSSRAVLDRLIARGATGVLGNHDLWLRDWMCGRGFDPFALHEAMGGRATLASYEVVGRRPGEVELQSWRAPRAHRELLAGLPMALDLWVCGVPYWLTHAGVPASASVRGVGLDGVVPWLAAHRPEVLLWSATDPQATHPLDRTQIMGHMIQPAPLDTGEVLALDTGCGTAEDGYLSAVILPDRRFVTVG